jgi:hypothetical protein
MPGDPCAPVMANTEKLASDTMIDVLAALVQAMRRSKTSPDTKEAMPVSVTVISSVVRSVLVIQ